MRQTRKYVNAYKKKKKKAFRHETKGHKTRSSSPAQNIGHKENFRQSLSLQDLEFILYSNCLIS